MTHTMIKLLVLLACAGHLALWHCDWIITCLAGGRFDFRCLKDNEKLAAAIGETPLKRPMRSMVLGTFAMMAAFPGYLAVCEWMRQFSGICALLMALGSVMFFLPGVAHHVFCGAVEWFYIRMGKTEEARQTIVEFFGKTSSTMYVCYVGLLIFAVTLFVAVVSGTTSLPAWACVFNALPLFLVLAPFRIVGTGNLVNATVFHASSTGRASENCLQSDCLRPCCI